MIINIFFFFVFRKIFTNRSYFNLDGCLSIEPYYYQNWCHLSPTNLCKGHILTEYILKRSAEDGVHFDRINYVGDGQNDICPALRSLKSTRDRLFPRLGYSLDKYLREQKVTECKESMFEDDQNLVNAQVFPFTCGNDIWNVINNNDNDNNINIKHNQ